MALVVITITDEDGSVDIKLTAEPPIPGENSDREATAAHYAAMVAVNAMKEKFGG